MSSTAELKAHSNALSDESRHLRREARKVKKKWESARVRDLDTQYQYMELFQNLSNKRKTDIKNKSRAIYLARAYLDGKSYKSVESKRSDDVLFYHYILPYTTDIVNEFMDDFTFSAVGWVTYDEIKAWADAEPKKSFWSNFKFW